MAGQRRSAWLISTVRMNCRSRLFNRYFSPVPWLQVAEHEGSILNAPQSGDLVPQRFKESTDLAVLPSSQRHFQMRFPSGAFLNGHALTAQSLALIKKTDDGGLSPFVRHLASHRHEIEAGHSLLRVSQKA